MVGVTSDNRHGPQPQRSKVSCAAGSARPDGELKRNVDVGQQPQRRAAGSVQVGRRQSLLESAPSRARVRAESLVNAG